MPALRYEFDDGYEIGVDPAVVRRHGKNISIHPTALRFLCYLFLHRTREIGVDELQRISTGRLISSARVRGLVGEIYTVFGGAQNAGQVVWNDGHGNYRFIAAVKEVRVSPATNTIDIDAKLEKHVRDQCDERSDILEKLLGNLERSGWRTYITNRGEGVTNPEFDFQLAIGKTNIKLDLRPQLWDAREHYHPDLEAFVRTEADRRSSGWTNDPKIRIASEIIGVATVDIEQTNYLSSMMTDQLRWDRVRSEKLQSNGHPELILRDISTFLDVRSCRLLGLVENKISNQLAVSTLAFTRDGYLMIPYQNSLNRESANTLAPSGSGSMDWQDVIASAATDLSSLVRFGAQRELYEECALDPVNTEADRREEIASDVMVTGYTRLLHRCGKPEFYCLGYIAADAEELRQRKPERYVDHLRVADVGRARWQGERPRDGIATICDAYLAKPGAIPMSFQLQHSLHLLAKLCENEATACAVDAFIRRAIRRTGG